MPLVRVRVPGLASVLAPIVVAASVAACGGLEAARGSCDREGVGAVRCAAIVADATAHLEEGSLPTTGVEVRMATVGDRTSLRDQRLVAFVTFAFLDGSRREIRVFCRPALDTRGLCGPDPAAPASSAP